MSQAEALLNRVAGDSTYTATPETEPHIVIGADRFITVPDELKRLGVQGDKDIETVTFDCPRYWDDTDMSEMSVAINIQRKDGVSDKYLADNVVVDIEDQSMMHFDWTISKFVAEVKGALRFNVCISSVDESGKEVEHWNSEVCEDCYISEGLETDKQIVEAYPDVITQLRTTMENLLNSGMAVDVNVQKVGSELIVNVSGPEGSETFRLYDGADGKTPFIGNNGHWWIGEEDTGVTAAASTAGMMPASVYDPQGKKTDIFKYVEDNGVSAADRAKWDAKSNFSGSYNDLADKPTLFSGSYNDLTDKPESSIVECICSQSFGQWAGAFYRYMGLIYGYVNVNWTIEPNETMRLDFTNEDLVGYITNHIAVPASTVIVNNDNTIIGTANIYADFGSLRILIKNTSTTSAMTGRSLEFVLLPLLSQ